MEMYYFSFGDQKFSTGLTRLNKVVGRLCSLLDTIGEESFSAHSSCWKNSVPPRGRTQVHVLADCKLRARPSL